MKLFQKTAPWLTLACLGLFVYYVVTYPSSFATYGTLILGWVLFILTIAYQHVDKLYWATQKAKYYILNPDTQWDLSVRYSEQQIGTASLELVKKQLCKIAEVDRPVIKASSLNSFEIKADELNIEVTANDNDCSLEVYFTKIPVSFRGSQRFLETRISRALDVIEEKLSITHRMYWLTVYFGNLNPYFGLYVRRIRPQELISLNVRIATGKDKSIDISKTKLTITETSLIDLQNSARKYITLSELPA